jgi:hypothetical protein
VLLSLLCLLPRLLLRGPSSDWDRERELELELERERTVLRHELMVLKRKVDRLKLRRVDKVFLAVLSRLLHRQRRSSFIVTPDTYLRWHRELVKRTWAH